MDGFLHDAQFSAALRLDAGGPRSFLFLQGPISNFFDQLGRALIARGHRVHRVNLHFGDQLFWRLPATHFRGRFDEWRPFIARMLEARQVTHLIIHGDRRPYHLVAAEEARARGITVFATDLGYVRPDWITLELDGMSTYSRFPREPAAIHALAEQFAAPDLMPRHHTPFPLIAALDVAYNLALVFGRAFYPNYRYHGVFHPFAEYAGWLWSRARRIVTARGTSAAKSRLQAAPGSYFLFPLQLAADFQIRAHSPFADARDAVREVVASFARSGTGRTLAVIVHPLDNGLIGWGRLVARLAAQFGVSDRVIALEGGGTPIELLCNAAGVVTINSTVGTTALYHGVPVKVLGNAVFDIPGLTSQQPLDGFWQVPSPPDPQLTTAFFRALTGATQVKGGYYTRASQAEAIAGFVERLEAGSSQLPPLDMTDLAARPVREPGRNVVIAGVSDEIGCALARAFAAPGTRLCLVGAVADILATAADDCLRRGAAVDAVATGPGSHSAIADRLRDFDRGAPVDLLVVHVGAADEWKPRRIIDPAGRNRRLADRNLAGTITVVGALAEGLRRRGRGHVVVVGAGGRLRHYGASLRQRFQQHGVSVSLAIPGTIATRLAVRFDRPTIAEVNADRAARLICAGILRGRETIALPGALTAAARVLQLSPSLLRQWARDRLLPQVEPVVDAVDKAPLPEESGTGD